MRRKHIFQGFAFGAAIALMIMSAGPVNAAKKNEASIEPPHKSVARVPLAKIHAASGQIDRLIAADLVKHKIEPNPLSSDEVFFRGRWSERRLRSS